MLRLFIGSTALFLDDFTSVFYVALYTVSLTKEQSQTYINKI